LAAKAKILGRRILEEVATNRHTRYASGLAPEADRAEVRWQPTPRPWTSSHSREDPGSGSTHGRGESGLGLSEDPRRSC
jgi:hypothetical protein